jgi:hypothetical protein
MSISLDIMRSRSGIYLITVLGGYGFVEVDQDHRVWQLDPHTYNRDGELVEGGWTPQAILHIHGPFKYMGAVQAQRA